MGMLMRIRKWRAGRAGTLVALTIATTLATCSDGLTWQPRSGSGPHPITDAESATLDLAEQILLRDCMGRHGFKTWLIRRDKLPGDGLRAFPYAITDKRWAEQHGYGGDLRREAARLAASDPNKRYFDRLSATDRARATAALIGTSPVGLTAELLLGGIVRRSDDGCVSEAERTLYGNLPHWYRAEKVTEQLKPLRVRRVVNDARFKAAAARWSACMRSYGHTYSDPAEARTATMARIEMIKRVNNLTDHTPTGPATADPTRPIRTRAAEPSPTVPWPLV